MSKHTPGPWTAVDGALRGADGLVPLRSPYREGAFRDTDYQPDVNAARIVACVNACEGIDPAAVPGLVAALETISARLVDPNASVVDIAEMRILAWDTLAKARQA